jgi:hypothetical protein
MGLPVNKLILCKNIIMGWNDQNGFEGVSLFLGRI